MEYQFEKCVQHFLFIAFVFALWNCSTKTVIAVDVTTTTTESTTLTVTTDATEAQTLPTVTDIDNNTPATVSPSKNDDSKSKGRLQSVTIRTQILQKYSNCSGLPLLGVEQQPNRTSSSVLRKCCPMGFNYEISSDTKHAECVPENIPFNVSIINAVFYRDCIEDTEAVVTLAYKFGGACRNSTGNVTSSPSVHRALTYGQQYGDLLYVLQNGSLLRVDGDFADYDVFHDYCLDMDRVSKNLVAIVCTQEQQKVIARAEAFLNATCMLVSVPCLLITAFLYFRIEEFRDLHGKSLACHSLCLALGFIFTIIVLVNGRVTQGISCLIQYFILACFIWLAVMCAYICIQVWYCLPRNIVFSERAEMKYFLGYFVIAFGVPLLLTLLTYSQGLHGVPAYYFKGVAGETESTHWFFITPVCLILIASFALLVASYYGFLKNKPLPRKKRKQSLPQSQFSKHVDYELYQDAKRMAKSTAILYAVMSICTVLEMIETAASSDSSSLAFFDILIALQGVVIFIIFICLPAPLQIVKHWWVAQGSLDLHTTEMEVLNAAN